MQRLISNPLQTIMSKVQSFPILRLKYFNCKKGDLHDGEVLNYVCIQKSCKQKGVICSVCKHDHNGHNVVPLKFLLNTLKQHKENPAIESQTFQKQLEQLEELKNSFLYDLKQTVEQLAEKIMQVEQYIIDKFKKQKVELLNQIEVKMRFNEIIESALGNKFGDQEQFEKDFRVIASAIENRKETNVESNAKSNDFYFSAQLDKLVSQYQHSYQQFSKNLTKFTTKSTSTLQKFTKQPQSKTQPTILKQPESTNQLQVTEYKFNLSQKGSNLKITDNKKTAECVTSGNERFALIDGPVHKQGSVIRFRVEKLKNWVGLGLAIRDTIKNRKFLFEYNTLGHGSYLLSNNNYMWSHTSSAHNIQASDFSFSTGQIIKIEVTEKELIYTNESNQNKEKRIPILLTEHEWTQACFCVNLCSIGDAATIL